MKRGNEFLLDINMGLINKIREFINKIKKSDTKMLEAPPREDSVNIKQENENNNVYNKNVNKMEQYVIKKEQRPITPSVLKLNKIDGAIEQYLYSLISLKMENQNITSYRALTEACAFMDRYNPGRNKETENILLNNIKNNDKYRLLIQKQQNTGLAVYYHIAKGKAAKYVGRIYLNCKRENVALLVNSLINEFNDLDSFYLKFVSDNKMQERGRTDRIVIFVPNNKEEDKKLEKCIYKLQSERPELFADETANNPFLESRGNVMYALQPDTEQYVTLSGRIEIIAKSYNTFLAKALEESYLKAINEIVAQDNQLYEKFGGMINNNSINNTLNILENIMNNSNKELILIEKIKSNLRICQQNNKCLRIKGINERKDTPYNPIGDSPR